MQVAAATAGREKQSILTVALPARLEMLAAIDMRTRRLFPLLALALAQSLPALADVPAQPDPSWFELAKFGLFIHWGLYSVAGNEWQGRTYHGSSEWLMHRLKIPAAQYAALAKQFDPVNFNAAEWARFAHDAGVRYLVITAKHHEGFAMFDSKVSPFNIVDATPYRRDPMTALAQACRAEGIHFGFYYSQFLDWHEPNGGGNTWDFPGRKNYAQYYAAKSTPQIRELLSNYGPIDIVWFDMAGGLSRGQTQAFVEGVRRLQPACLISSRVGQGFGDFRDFGDSELPPRPIPGPWEALYTHNDSWGFDRGDFDFKSPEQIIRLLASVSARGGNLILNVGPDGTGRIPELSVRYLTEVGRWLRANSESIYGTLASPIPDQPWGVATLSRATPRLYLHLFERPTGGTILIPGFTAKAVRVGLLQGGRSLAWLQKGDDLYVQLPETLADPRDTVAVVDFSGNLRFGWADAPSVVSNRYPITLLEASSARLSGAAGLRRFDNSWYFGNWKHMTCVVGQQGANDAASFPVRFAEAGDYRIELEYSCSASSENQNGVVTVGNQTLPFATLLTGNYDKSEPLVFIRHPIGVVRIAAPGTTRLTVRPTGGDAELFRLRRVVIEPVE